MQYKKTNKNLKQIARELSVDGLLEGTVVISGGRVRVRAQLIRAETDEHIWAEAYERDLGNILGLENQLANDIAHAVRGQLQPGTATRRADNADAHQLYLKGRYLWNKRDLASLNRAVEYFHQALAKDPTYAAAFSGLADCYVLLAGYNFVPPAEAVAKARAAAESALQLDDSLAEAHTSLALIEIQDGWNWERSRRHFERAIELNPNYATAHHWYADAYLAQLGLFDEAIAEIRKAHELDPLSPIIATDIGKVLYFSRRYDESIRQLRQVLDVDPNFWLAHSWLSHALIEKGQYAEAAAEMELATSDTAASRFQRLCPRAYVFARAGQRTQARGILMEFAPEIRRKQADPGCLAIVNAALGDKDQAFAWLDQAYLAKSSYLNSLRTWPPYDPLRSDPRFQELSRRIGLQ